MRKCFAEESGKNEKREWIYDLSRLFYSLEDCWKFGLKGLSCVFGIAVAVAQLRILVYSQIINAYMK